VSDRWYWLSFDSLDDRVKPVAGWQAATAGLRQRAQQMSVQNSLA